LREQFYVGTMQVSLNCQEYFTDMTEFRCRLITSFLASRKITIFVTLRSFINSVT